MFIDSGISVSPVITPKTLQKPKEEKESNLSFEATEFVSFTMYRLWQNKNSSKPHTSATAQDSSLNHIVCSPGTEDWYPQFAMKVNKLLRKAKLPTAIIFVSLLYIARLRQAVNTVTPREQLSQLLYQLLVSSLVVAQKQHSDFRYKNSLWAEMSGFSLSALNTLESNFLKGIHWKLHVTDDQYMQWVKIIQTLGKEHALVLKAVAMPAAELKKLETEKLKARVDLIEEIALIRKFRDEQALIEKTKVWFT
ncbi:hypothetical protein HDV06_001999 [Boothiomyces sp. JEL0866]|nr:hypothetical protein HDV06_001999 [Boothiomyces sp. JEL0866]